MHYSKSKNGFFDRHIHGDDIPDDAVEISADLHAALLVAQAEGKIIIADAGGHPMAVDPPPPDLATVRAAALTAVAEAAAAARNVWRTPGKDGVYLSKLADADAWDAAGQPAALDAYPYLAAEVGITAETAAELVTMWRTMAVAWAATSAQIERIEMSSKAAIKAADTSHDIAAVLAGLEWPTP